MEDRDIIFLGYGSSNSLDSTSTEENRRHNDSDQTTFPNGRGVPSANGYRLNYSYYTEENRRHNDSDQTTFLNGRGVPSANDFGNYPGTSGNQGNVGLYDDVLPPDYFLQTPPMSDFEAQYNNIFGSRVGEEVTLPNVAGVVPNETQASPPKLKRPRAKPKVERKRKIQKVKEAVVKPKKKGKSSYQRLLDLQEYDLVRNTEGATCNVCDTEVPPGAGVVLKDCLHIFCCDCLEEEVQISESVQVRCPFVSDEYSCESYLQDREVRQLVSPLDYELLVARSVPQTQSKAIDGFDCAKPGCWGFFLPENGTYGTCSNCLSKNCVSCKTIHDAMGCPREKDITFERYFSNKLEEEVQKLQEEQKSDDYCSVEEQTNMGPLTNTENLPAGYRTLLEVTDKGLVNNTGKFDCPICFSEIEIGEGVTLKDCLHNYCRECLKSTIILHSETVVVKCPFVNDEYSCESFIQEREIKSLLTHEEYERHLARGLALAERQSANSFHCKTPDCTGWCLVEDDATQFVCQVCQHSNCLSCAAIHEGKNCKQYQGMAALQSDTSVEDKKTRQYLELQLRSNKAMVCPQCQVILMKREGCDWLICSMCRTQICWATRGPRWGPGGVGDTSGGCKCDFRRGKPCHPRCKNCH